MTVPHVDVLIVGAGLSGIGAAYHLKTRCPDRTFAILEGRRAIGGTWDLFRYPGVRSDTDMHTLGYGFQPWTRTNAIASGQEILDYVRETAASHGIDRTIRYDSRVEAASWSTETSRWTVEIVSPTTEARSRMTCQFLYMCTGYYDYAQGHAPQLPGSDHFRGSVIHPQFWDADVDYADKRVVVIGSGATAVTLVPAMARQAAHVTMLQRSPTYIVNRPSVDTIANRLARLLPRRLAFALARWKNVAIQIYFYRMARRQPAKVRAALIDMVRTAVGPDHDIQTHFNPRYNPWDQRLCFVPDNDLFDALKQGDASIVTDEIDALTETGIRLKSGQELPADVIVTATGLSLQLMSNIVLTVDGERIEPAKALSYKGIMYSGIPNLASTFGYTTAAWTLRADLVATFVCRLLNTMQRRNATRCVPVPAADVDARPFIENNAGYVERARDRMPSQGSRDPWRIHQNYVRELVSLRYGRVDTSIELS